MRYLRILIATLFVALPAIVFGLIFIGLYHWSEWAIEHWSWAEESEPFWDWFSDYLPTKD